MLTRRPATEPRRLGLCATQSHLAHGLDTPLMDCPSATDAFRPIKFLLRPQVAILATVCMLACASQVRAQQPASRPLLVVGFMGGRVKATNLVHKEAVVARDLQQKNPVSMQVLTFANHDGANPLKAVLQYVDTNHDGQLSPEEKATSRIVLYGHSWGASETVQLARQLGAKDIPVLLTIQVDSVQKYGENDGVIPANVHEAINFYQTEGLLHGRPVIRAEDPTKTTILGNNQLSYKADPVACRDFPWFARTFMRPHIEIENDPKVWARVEAMIQEQVR